MRAPTVRRIVLFKHGLAYVERGGPCDGAFELSFEKDEMKDVLKSLAVWVAAGEARPTAIAFDKPDDPLVALAERGLDLPEHASFTALLTALRGRRVRVREREQWIAGEVIGLQDRARAQHAQSVALALRVERGSIRVIDLDDVREVELDDPAAVADLELLLDRRRAATSTARRAVRIGVEGAAEDLRVTYVLPAPVWRVSYRIAVDRDDARLAAWAIVHNPLDEDVEDVALTLTTGQPISFDIDLYRPKTVTRVVVEESSRAAAAPTQYERGRAMAKPAAPMAMAMAVGGAMPSGAPGFGPPLPAAAPAPAPMAPQAMLGIAEAAELADRGELFEFRIAHPVTLRRGGSALAPLISARLEPKKERIWRDGSPPSPDLVIAFRNETGAVLEEGAAVVYDGGVYAGEAMVPYTVRGAEVKLAYAKDLAVRCRRQTTSRTFAASLRLGDRFVAEQQRIEDRHVLRADSDHDEPVEVVLELPRRHDRVLAEASAKPFEETASYRRFRATVPPRGHVEVEVIDHGHGARHLEYGSLTPAQLEHWLREGILEGSLRQGLTEIVQAWAEAQSHEQRASQLGSERAFVQDGQAKIASQLAVLRDAGPEAELRLRYVRELGQSQDRVVAIDQEIAAAREAAAAARRRAELRLAALLRRAPA